MMWLEWTRLVAGLVGMCAGAGLLTWIGLHHWLVRPLEVELERTRELVARVRAQGRQRRAPAPLPANRLLDEADRVLEAEAPAVYRGALYWEGWS